MTDSIHVASLPPGISVFIEWLDKHYIYMIVLKEEGHDHTFTTPIYPVEAKILAKTLESAAKLARKKTEERLQANKD